MTDDNMTCSESDGYSVEALREALEPHAERLRNMADNDPWRAAAETAGGQLRMLATGLLDCVDIDRLRSCTSDWEERIYDAHAAVRDSLEKLACSRSLCGACGRAVGVCENDPCGLSSNKLSSRIAVLNDTVECLREELRYIVERLQVVSGFDGADATGIDCHLDELAERGRSALKQYGLEVKNDD